MPKPLADASKPSAPVGDDVEDAAGDGGADELRREVAGCVLPVEALRGGEPDRHGGVEVPARDGSEGVRAGQDREAERQGDAERADAAVAAGQDGRADAAEDEPEGAERFGAELVGCGGCSHGKPPAERV